MSAHLLVANELWELYVGSPKSIPNENSTNIQLGAGVNYSVAAAFAEIQECIISMFCLVSRITFS